MVRNKTPIVLVQMSAWSSVRSKAAPVLGALALRAAKRLGVETCGDPSTTVTELKEMKAFLNAAIENIPVGILVKDAKSLRVVLVNRAAEKLHGIPRDQAIGRT